MKKPKMTPDDIKIAIEQPDRYSSCCEQHKFHVKEIAGKGMLIVYTEKISPGKHTVICADWLKEVEKE